MRVLYEVYESLEAELEKNQQVFMNLVSSQISPPNIIKRGGDLCLNQHSYMWRLDENIRKIEEI